MKAVVKEKQESYQEMKSALCIVLFLGAKEVVEVLEEHKKNIIWKVFLVKQHIE